MEALQLQHYYTIEDIYALPEGRRAELIDGQIYDMAPPSRIHQEALLFLTRKIADYIDSKGGLCKIYPAPFAVFLNKDNINYVEPDISVICDKNKLDDKGCNGAPDWIIEITWPGNPAHDYIAKLSKYKAAGVREYWIVDPMKEMTLVYYFENDNFGVNPYTFKDSIKVNIYDDLHIDFTKLHLS
jgi:Uma2 family endonuclease